MRSHRDVVALRNGNFGPGQRRFLYRQRSGQRSEDGKKLECVNISIPGTNIGTVTNKDGKFVLKLKKSLSANVIEISHIGYLNCRRALEGKMS